MLSDTFLKEVDILCVFCFDKNHIKQRLQYTPLHVKKIFSVYPELDTTKLTQGTDAPAVVSEVRGPLVDGLIACARLANFH